MRSPTQPPPGSGSDLADHPDVVWLREVLGAGHGPAIDHVVLPLRGPVRFLVPCGRPRVAAACLRRGADDDGPFRTAATLAARATARTGLLPLLPLRTVALRPFPLVDHLAGRLGEPELVAAVGIGPPRRNRKPVLTLVRPDGRIVGFAKVGWSPLTRELVDDEATVLRLIEGRLPTDHHAPVVLDHGPWRDLSVVVLSQVRAPLARWGTAPTVAGTVRAVAGAVDGGTVAVADLAALADWERAWDLLPADRATLARARVATVIGRHRGVGVPVGLWHGDLTPWNRATRGRHVHLWDWELAASGRPVGFDALHGCFEHHRRGGVGAADALAALEREGPGLLTTVVPGLGSTAALAVIDLYLCELLAREARLGGQAWSGGALAGLGPAVEAVLERRLGPVDPEP